MLSPFRLDFDLFWANECFCTLQKVQEAISMDETARIKAILPTEAERRLNPGGQDFHATVFTLDTRVVHPDNLEPCV